MTMSSKINLKFFLIARRINLLHDHIFQIDQSLFYDEMTGFLTQENQEV